MPKGGVEGGERAASLGSNARRLPRHEERVEYIGVSLLFSEKERLHLHRMEGATMGGASTRSQITLTHGLTAPSLFDLRRQWLPQGTPSSLSEPVFMERGKPRFMTANTVGYYQLHAMEAIVKTLERLEVDQRQLTLFGAHEQ